MYNNSIDDFLLSLKVLLIWFVQVIVLVVVNVVWFYVLIAYGLPIIFKWFFSWP